MPLFFNQIITSKFKRLPNKWDAIALLLIVTVFALLAEGAKQMAAPYHIGQQLPISLDPSALPNYALRSVLRMGIGLIFSLLFTFTIATWAAKSRRAEMIIIPLIDILQSVPVLALLSFTIVGFIHLFPSSLLGPECAAIFTIFTSQVWNMALSFYQSLKTIPSELVEAADMFHLSAWQRFWRIEVPFAMPALLWNTMLSMSGSWFFVVTSEAISVANQDILLPGIGSYIAVAVLHANSQAVIYAIIAMFLVILIYDQLLFRPLVKWSEKFNVEQNSTEQTSSSWVINLLQRTQIFQYASEVFKNIADSIINFSLFKSKKSRDEESSHRLAKLITFFWYLMLMGIILAATWLLVNFILKNISLSEVQHVVLLGIYTGLRVLILIILCSIVWVPIGVWIGMRPRVRDIVQPLTQFLAAFPAYLFFPVVVMVIVKYHLNVEIWTAPLMILGTQWYILFNVIAAASALPKDLNQVANNFGVRGWLWWRRVILPGIFPYYITGAITAAGGAWNASIVAEVVSWGNKTLTATGLGAYIKTQTTVGNFPRIALGIAVMCVLVLLLNRLIWRPLYILAQSRFLLE